MNEALTVFERPPRKHVTLAVPPVPDVSMCHDQLTCPLLPTVWLYPLNDRGA